MALLMLFALVAGAGTALSPCVLPVLPGGALGAASRAGAAGRSASSPGWSLSFTFATVALVYVIDALGLPDDLCASSRSRRSSSSAIVAAGPAARRPRRGAASAASSRARPDGAARASARGLVARRQPRPRLRALRGADPRRRDHRLRLAGLHRGQARGRPRLRDRLRRGALRADARRPPARRPAEAVARPGPGGDWAR